MGKFKFENYENEDIEDKKNIVSAFFENESNKENRRKKREMEENKRMKRCNYKIEEDATVDNIIEKDSFENIKLEVVEEVKAVLPMINEKKEVLKPTTVVTLGILKDELDFTQLKLYKGLRMESRIDVETTHKRLDKLDKLDVIEQKINLLISNPVPVAEVIEKKETVEKVEENINDMKLDQILKMMHDRFELDRLTNEGIDSSKVEVVEKPIEGISLDQLEKSLREMQNRLFTGISNESMLDLQAIYKKFDMIEQKIDVILSKLFREED